MPKNYKTLTNWLKKWHLTYSMLKYNKTNSYWYILVEICV